MSNIQVPRCKCCNSTDNLLNMEGVLILVGKEYNDVLEKIKELNNPKCYVDERKLFASSNNPLRSASPILLSGNPGVALLWALIEEKGEREGIDEFVKITRNMFA